MSTSVSVSLFSLKTLLRIFAVKFGRAILQALDRQRAQPEEGHKLSSFLSDHGHQFFKQHRLYL
jgi:hypothetical protein